MFGGALLGVALFGELLLARAGSTRRRVIEMLVEKGEHTATQFAESFPMTRQGVTSIWRSWRKLTW